MATMTLSEMLIIRKGLNCLINFYLGAIKQLKIWGFKSNSFDDLEVSLSKAESALKKINEEIEKIEKEI